MKKYSIKIEVDAVVEAFSSEDAKEYITDIFGVDEEIVSVKIKKIEER